MAAIEIEGLQKSYSVGFWRKTQRWGLKDLSLRVEEGEVFGYLGPNGAGKTTTLKLLMGLIYPTSGSAKILGMDIRDPRVKSTIGFLPEQPYFYDYLTATELLNYYAQLSDISARDRKRRVPEVLGLVGLSEAAGTQLRKFSKGMLQRVGIAQAMVHDPKILFLDEPMSGLDPVGRREVRDLIQELHDAGKTIFFSTHILSDAEALCHRVAVLNRGELRGVGIVADLIAESQKKVEVLWEGGKNIESIKVQSTDYRETGEVARAVVDEVNLNVTLDALRTAKARLISVTPVRGTLEQYFLQRVDHATSDTPSLEGGA